MLLTCRYLLIFTFTIPASPYGFNSFCKPNEYYISVVVLIISSNDVIILNPYSISDYICYFKPKSNFICIGK